MNANQSKSMGARRAYRALGTALISLLGLSLWAQAQPRVDSVDLGFNGRYLPESFTPLTITISNGNLPIAVTVEIAQEIREQSNALQKLSIPVSLGPGTRKTLAVAFLIHSVSAPLIIRLLDERSQELTKTEIDLRERWSERALALALETPEIPGAIPLEFDRLPKRWTGYAGVQRIYWGRLDPARLNPEQRMALQQWLLRGGELVILGGRFGYEQTGEELRAAPRETAQGWWAGLLPITNAKIIEADGVARIVGEPRPGTRMALTDLSAGHTLWWERAVGLGRVWLSATDTFSEALNSRDASRVDEAFFIENLLGRTTIPTPSKELLGTILVLFVFGVGLGGMWALRRPSMIFILPVGTLLVTLLLWGYLRAPDFTQHRYSVELNLLMGWSAEPLIWEQSWYAFYARRSGEQALISLGDAVKGLARSGQPPRDLKSSLSSSAEQRLGFYSDRESIRSFKSERFLPAEVEFSIDTSVSPAKVWVYNKSTAGITNALVHFDGTFYILGEIAAGARLSRPFSELPRTTEDRWERNLPEPVRTLWQQSKRLKPASGLIGWWQDKSQLSPWQHQSTEQRASATLLYIAEREETP